MTFVNDKILQCIEQLDQRRRKKTPVTGFMFKECGYKTDNTLPAIDDMPTCKPTVANESVEVNACRHYWQEFKDGERWGQDIDSHAWFYKKLDCETDCMLSIKTGREGQWDASNPQFIAYIDGVLTQGLDVNHSDLPLTAGVHEVYLYAYSGMQKGLSEFIPSLDIVDEAIEKLYYDIKVPYDICQYLDINDKRYVDILGRLSEAVNIIDYRDSATYVSAAEYLSDVLYDKYSGNSDVSIVCIGHTHIDVAWLWTYAQTREKVQRSFATVVNLMKKYPEYIFMSSQAQLYKFLKEDAPELYEEVKELIKQGRWEVEGAMWVEADCNLSSGESLVRQILFGKRFFKQEFDVDSKILWLPDVFGYSAALPQILIKSGVNTFVTSKISWNEFNQMPHDVFMWEGIDGTEIFTYFMTAQNKKRGKGTEVNTTYVGTITPEQVAGTWDRFQDKHLSNEAIITFGHGDGGGGPTAKMLENQRRLSKGIKGCHETRIDTATNFLKKLHDNAVKSPYLAKWVGELYLELHRGTYTSIAKNKKNNRECEFLYQNTELLSCINMTLNNEEYPQAELNNGWEKILINQFHDVIPGSSIKEVYDDSDIHYAEVRAAANEINDKNYKLLLNNIKTDGGILVFNPHSFVNSDVVSVDGKLIFAKDIPAKGWAVIKACAAERTVKVTDNTIENDFFTVSFADGDITSIFDKQNNREVIAEGKRANLLQAFEDYPKCYDAWEITDYYKDKLTLINDVVSIKPIDEGVRGGFEIVRKFLSSTITQKIVLYSDVAKIDFITDISWNEEHILLKAAFPVDVHTSKATYDVQFGNLERPTHQNTSWDAARFEVCAHKFADLSEDNYGVSLINNCKYGYDIVGNVMRLTLLKCATYPNPEADKGEHSFTYTLYPHAGNFKEGGTVQAAYSSNIPMTAFKIPSQDGKLSDVYSFVGCDCENVIVETVKKAEDSKAIVLRINEQYGRRVKAKLTFGFDVKKAYVTDMLENELQEIAVNDNTVELAVKPYEILTIKLQ